MQAVQGYARVGEEKKLFGRNILEHEISIDLSFVSPPLILTFGSDVRGKTGSISVKDGSNYFLSLWYIYLD